MGKAAFGKVRGLTAKRSPLELRERFAGWVEYVNNKKEGTGIFIKFLDVVENIMWSDRVRNDEVSKHIGKF